MISRALSAFLLLLIPIGVGVPTGVAVFTFHYADGISYFKDNPKACMNCHVMKSHFGSWNQSTHRAVAKCNDCHSPENPIGKVLVKALNGFNHSWAFTFDTYPDPIRIRPWNKAITQNSCINCHSSLLDHPSAGVTEKPMACVKCHKGVGHSF